MGSVDDCIKYLGETRIIFVISNNSPLIFVLITLTISIAWAMILFFRYLRKKGKHIAHIYAALSVILFMGIIGAILGLITDSEPILIIVYSIGLGFIGAIVYLIMEMIDRIKKT